MNEAQNEKTIAQEIVVQHAVPVNADVLPAALNGKRSASVRSNREYALEPAIENMHYEPADASLLSMTRVDAARLIRTLQQLEILAKRQTPRIAIKAKGRTLFLDVAEIVAVEAEGNYISLRHRTVPYLLRESLSSMAEKLEPYGFMRIHRSVIVNISAVEEIQPLPTGEYRLLLKGGREYFVTRRYKDSLRNLAQLWVGAAFGS
jgi:DNA-binding LytR/AlgR family response regulator